MKFVVLSVSILALSASAALAEPIADRKAQMKARGALVGELAPIARGQRPYDAAKVMATLEEMSKNAETDVSVLWPTGSEAGDHTSAPKVWEDPSAFKAAVDKYPVGRRCRGCSESAGHRRFPAAVRCDNLELRRMPRGFPGQARLI
ncbi:cytochrome c [Mesorhizobium sp. J428]|uniref:cytochrome c n=1 Tax=Mesorhizobium sp. J428 TaxID=2898440 RepID=UPI0021507383|nr:cytochrome c [Mesorhizobium sp. J428]MCR5858870.1 cytochrome c [Mesorhizobium sp. J428]